MYLHAFEALSEEAQTGFEPVDTGVADHCLTAWLLRHNISRKSTVIKIGMIFSKRKNPLITLKHRD